MLSPGCSTRSITSYQPPRWRSPPTVGMSAAIWRAKASYSSFGFRLYMRIRFQAIFRLCPTTPRFCCHMWVLVVRPIFEEFLLHERAVVVIREMRVDRIEGVFEHLGVALLAGRQVQIDQIGRGMVADRVPVLLAPVGAQATRCAGRA